MFFGDMFEQQRLYRCFTEDNYIIEAPADYWHVTFNNDVRYHAPRGAKHCELTFNYVPSLFNGRLPRNIHERRDYIERTLTDHSRDVLQLSPGMVHVLFPWETVNSDLLNYVGMNMQWKQIVQDSDRNARTWYRPFTKGSLEDKAQRLCKLFPDQAHVVAFTSQCRTQ